MVANRMKRKKGQAMIETIFMLPFIIVVLFFIYQSYTLVNKVQVVQKYLKGGILGNLMNRNIITAESLANVAPPADGKYFVIYNDNKTASTGSAGKYMKVSLDEVTINMLLYFCPSDTKTAISTYLKGQQSIQTLGVCIGGADKMGDQVNSESLKLADGEICGAK